jgi:hypothetical protein
MAPPARRELLERTLEGLLAAPPEGLRPGLCLDRVYDYPWVPPGLTQFGYEPHVHSRGEEARLLREGARARRWVVESTFAWLVLFRRLKISHERLATTRSTYRVPGPARSRLERVRLSQLAAANLRSARDRRRGVRHSAPTTCATHSLRCSWLKVDR